MIVFDASGSMAGNVNQGIATIIPRIDEVRGALSKVLPSATRFRRVGLITFGPGPYNQCNVQLNFAPTPNAADSIMSAVNALTPAGKTPLTSADEQAAEVLDYRHRPAVIVVVTDGEETCGRSPCDLGKQLHDAAFQLSPSTSLAIGSRIIPGQASRASMKRSASPRAITDSTSPLRAKRISFLRSRRRLIVQ